MTIRDVLVYVDNDPGSAQRVALGGAIARAHGARLSGVYVRRELIIPAYAGVHIPPEVLAVGEQANAELAEAAAKGFADAVRGADLETAWEVWEGRLPEALGPAMRRTDLAVLAQPDPDGSDFHPLYRPDLLVLEAGRPALVVPYAGEFSLPSRHALVAWDGGREATRAVHDALPLLEAVSRVSVVTISRRARSTHDAELLVEHLVRHGLTVELHNLPATEIAAGDLLLSHAADEGCDLIVMGAYGHSRFRETVLGGMTRHLLEHMTVPVLLSH